MRRPTLAAGLVLALVLAAGCGPREGAEPTVASVDFSPRAVIVADDDGLACRPADGCTLPPGSVVEVRNDGSGPRRLQGDGGRAFDTGELRPGEALVVVLGRAGEGDGEEIEVADPADPAQVLPITVLPGRR